MNQDKDALQSGVNISLQPVMSRGTCVYIGKSVIKDRDVPALGFSKLYSQTRFP